MDVVRFIQHLTVGEIMLIGLAWLCLTTYGLHKWYTWK